MPPRKRTAGTPKPDPEAGLLTDDDSEQQDSDAEGSTAPAPPDDTEDKSKRSSRRHSDQPCTTCFPEGWPDGAAAVGCAHGSWTRD